MLRYRLGLVVAMLVSAVATVVAQTTATAYELDAIVVTGDRAETPIASSTSAVSRLSASDLEILPVTDITDALSLLPGLTFFNRDGFGRDGVANVRGFYGGGEAEYLVVLRDGVPVNDAETGIVDWDTLALAGVQSIEVLRGAAGSLYGDAALGGVVNLLTTGTAAPATTLSMSGGTFGAVDGSLYSQGDIGGRAYTLSLGKHSNDGYRAHAERRADGAVGSISLVEGERSNLKLVLSQNWTRSDSPGPLTGPEVAADPRASSPFYGLDHSDERRSRQSLVGDVELSSSAKLTGNITRGFRRSDVTRTLPLSPEFVDTKHRELRADSLTATAKVTADLPLDTADGRIVFGVDAAAHDLDSTYYQLLSGGRVEYDAPTTAARAVDERGAATRDSVAAFAQYELRPTDALNIVVGGRLDTLRDEFTPRLPSMGVTQEATHNAFSPKLGVSLRYASTRRHSGHLYGNLHRGFKAPTPDQLFDRRSIPVPFEPYKILISNGDLRPQFATNREIGLRHRVAFAPRIFSVELSVAGYSIGLKDELDFSLEEFRTVNIGRSRHRGVEAGLAAYLCECVRLFANYTHQDATSRTGDNFGRRLKAIPRHVVVGGATARLDGGVRLSAIVRSTHDIYLDDANTISLPDYTVVDAKVAWRLRSVDIAVEALNLLGEEYSSTGFPDTSGSGAVYFYPAAERAVRFTTGLRL
ncbi:TonB-dependent receptor [Candidatus Poribacteria bacterium]|nr:TonB-dependent receptor [Candidatus Poribacteria bacterium]MBT5532972.1 TonB-dependent receptor [Candidatus Poribacteria bacterium]MBT5713478.1 TonB-dependent receptor [Candidatus Poribacteria bacterium]MBT7805201.1 TonB-dependent receptor [Candidatus Poribacteria bacterium]